MPTKKDNVSNLRKFNTNNNKLRDTVKRDIQNLFPIEGNKHKLELTDIDIPTKKDRKNFKEQLGELDKGGTFSENIYGNMRLVSQDSGEIIDEKKKKLAELPIETNRGTFIVEGKEYAVPKLFKLRPGVYHQKDNKGNFKAQFNLKRGTGQNFNIEYRPEKNKFKLITSYPKRTFDAYPILSAAGISDSQMQDKWGEEVLQSNKSKENYRSTLEKFYKDMNNEDPEGKDLEGFARDFINEGEFDEIVTRNTLDDNYEKMQPEAVLASTENLIEMARGNKEPDDRDSIMFKSLSNPVDLVDDRLKDWSTQNQIKRKIYRNLNQKEDINRILRADIINDPIEKFFTTSQIAELPEQTNPIDFVKHIDKTTALGEGALQDTRNVPSEARGLNPSELGFIDPVVTPESEKTGLVTHLAYNTTIDEETGDLLTKLYSKDEGKHKRINPRELQDAVVSFADQYEDKNPEGTPKRNKVKAMKDGTIQMVKPNEVEYIMDDPKTMLSVESMLVPFLSSDQGNRTQMATKMLNQALPMRNPESPNVQSKFNEDKTTEEFIGERMIEKAQDSGTVKEINREDGYIDVDYGSESVRHHMYNNFPLNRESFLDSRIKVEEGQDVSAGDVLFDTNFTENGELAIGKNLKTAYVPRKLQNFEDAVVASESATDKLTTQRIKKYEVPKGDEVKLDKNKFIAHFPDSLESEKLNKLDDKGLPEEGQEIEKGDPIAAYLKEREITKEEAALGKFHKKLLEPWMENIDEWDEDQPAKVDAVVEKPNKYEIRVKSERPAELGSKISNRHGMKGVIGKILPDSEMPKDESGEPIDILLNPHSVVSRMNLGQLYENASGKLAESEETPYDKFVVEQFDDENYKDLVQEELDKYNIKDKEKIEDPQKGELEEPVAVGQQYTMVLDHDPRDKLSARDYTDPYTINMTPQSGKDVGGQNIGPLAFNSMLAHGARKNLHEMSEYKSEKNPEFWRAVETGNALPSPEPTFPWKKFANQLSAAGINVEKDGDKIKMLPITDDDVAKQTSGEVESGQGVRAKDLKPIDGGLFDSEIFGGMQGNRWGHVELGEEMPNPIFEDAIKELAGINDKDYEKILRGEKYVDKSGNIIEKDNQQEKAAQVREGASTGSEGIKNLLNNIDIKNEIKQLEEQAKTQTGSDLNKSHRKLRYLKNLDDLDADTDVFFNKKWSVIPPKFRPVFPTEDGKLLESDLNLVYKDLIEDNKQLKEAADKMPEKQKGEMRGEVYKDLKALAGVGNNSQYENNKADGVLDIIAGRSPKIGFYQDKLLSRRQEQSGRAVAVPGPDLSPDELEIPEEMAWNVFRPKVVRDMVRNRGYTPLEAREEVDDKSEDAKESLYKISEKQPVLMNRAPSLHKFSIQAFKPKIKEDSHTIKVNPLVHKGYNLDHDGDAVSIHSPITEDAVDEAWDMVPSKNLYNPANNRLILQIMHEANTGLSEITDDSVGVENN